MAKELYADLVKPKPPKLDNKDFSASARLVHPTADLQNSLLSREFRVEMLPQDEPYRIVLTHLRERLFVTRKYFEYLMNGNEQRAEGFRKSRKEEVIMRKEELLTPLRLIFQSLCECGDGLIAHGALRDLMRRIDAFGISLARLDVRQESDRHSETIDAITRYLGIGSYYEWSEEKRCEFLIEEINSKRPLVNFDQFFTTEFATEMVKEVIATFKMLALIGSEALGAYIISMCRKPSDVLLVLLFQIQCNTTELLRISPLFETEQDLAEGPNTMKKLFSLPAYRHRINGQQEVMLGYSDSSKDAGKFASVWGLFKCQERLSSLCEKENIRLTIFHGRGGSVARGGGPQHLAILSQPGGSVKNLLRITIQGETIEQHFGLQKTAEITLKRYASATLLSSLQPPQPPKKEWRETMDELSRISSAHYRSIVHRSNTFPEYFASATPIVELGDLNLGSRPAKRRSVKGVSIEQLRAIPWVFSFTQTRIHLPVWLGTGYALKQIISEGGLPTLQSMAKDWPFFQSTLSLLEMVLAKADPRIGARYDELLVPSELKTIGARIRQELTETIDTILSVRQEKALLDQTNEDKVIMRSIAARHPFIDPLNLIQAETLKRLRNGVNDSITRDTLTVTIQGIAAGMQNTG